MHHTLLVLLALPYTSDCYLLGDREYQTRNDAFLRLKEAGVFAWPALYLMPPGNAEADERRERLLYHAGDWACRLAPLVLANESVDAKRVMKCWPQMAQRMCMAIDAGPKFEKNEDCFSWVVRTPYRTGSLEGDFELVVTSYRNGLRTQEPPVAQSNK